MKEKKKKKEGRCVVCNKTSKRTNLHQGLLKKYEINDYKVKKIKVRNTEVLDSTFQHCFFDNVHIEDSDLENEVIENSTLHYPFITDCHVNGGDFTDSTMESVWCCDSKLQNCSFTRVTFKDCDFTLAEFKNCKFPETWHFVDENDYGVGEDA